MHERGVRGEGLFDIRYGLKRFVLHVDQTGGVFRRITVSGYHNCHGLAHKTYFVLGQDRPITGLMRGGFGWLVFDSERLNGLDNIGSG